MEQVVELSQTIQLVSPRPRLSHIPRILLRSQLCLDGKERGIAALLGQLALRYRMPRHPAFPRIELGILGTPMGRRQVQLIHIWKQSKNNGKYGILSFPPRATHPVPCFDFHNLILVGQCIPEHRLGLSRGYVKENLHVSTCPTFDREHSLSRILLRSPNLALMVRSARAELLRRVRSNRTALELSQYPRLSAPLESIKLVIIPYNRLQERLRGPTSFMRPSAGN